MAGLEALTRGARLALAICLALVTTRARADAPARGVAPAAAVSATAADATVPDLSAKPLRLAQIASDAERGAIPELRYKDTAPPPGMWRRPAGKWVAAAGVVLLAAGTTVAVMNKRLSNDLESKYFDNALTPADASKYDQIDTYNTVQTVLFATGAAATGVGLYLWGTAPDEPGPGARVGVQGRF